MALWGSKKESNTFEEELKNAVYEPPLAQRVELLELEVAALKESLRESKKIITTLESILRNSGNEKMFNKLNQNSGIYAAFDEGKDIIEIAKEFGKGKGEIELILNLRNLK